MFGYCHRCVAESTRAWLGGPARFPVPQRWNDWTSPNSSLDARGTYICCAYSPRCFIIHKVKPSQALNPNADVFYSKDEVISEELLSDVNTEDQTCSLTDEPLPDDVCTQDGESLFPEDGSKLEIAVEDCSGNEQELPVAMNGTASVDLPLDLLSLSQDQVESDTSNIQQTDDIHSSDGTIPLPQLRALLQQQLEYYFSRENLATDTYLVSQMDSDQYVPIGTVANFNQIKGLTKDLNLIVEVLRESPHVQVDDSGKKVRPSHKRCVLILREIPETTPIKEIESLFDSENCPKFVSCEFAHNNSWYVTFESDEDAHRAYCYLREKVKTFQGKPIMARIKAKSITRASFIQPSKNGLRQPVESTMYLNQPQQQQQRYNYSSIPTVPYNNQQVYPPFYPPTMLQAWAPATPACFDLGTVFSINGLAPQASFKPIGNNGRHNLHMLRGRGSKSYNRMHQNYDTDQGSRLYDRGQSLPYVRQQHTMMNGTSGTLTYFPYAFNSRNPYAFGLDVHDIFASNTQYSKRQDSYSSLYSHTSHAQSQTSSQSRNVSKQEVTVGASHSSPVQESRIASELVKELPGQPQRNRNRRKKKEETSKPGDSNGNGLDNGNKSPSAKQECPKFDLEASSFPPLPGSLEAEGYDADIFESRLSDVVKGTVKPSMKDSKTQTSESALSNSNVTMKDSSTLTNGDLPPVVLTPPSSPEVVENFVSLQEEISEETFPENQEEESETVSPVPVVPTATVVTPSSPVNKSTCVVSSRSSSPPQNTSVINIQELLTTSKVMTKPIANKIHETEESHITFNGHLESDTPPNLEDDRPMRKLTYSEVAQRAKERVEKLAQELKEKERQEAVARLRQQEAQNRQPAPRGNFREFSKGRFTDQRSRIRDFRDRRTGFVNSTESVRHPENLNREEFRGDSQSTDVKPIK